MKTLDDKLHELDPDSIKVMIHRERDAEKFASVVASIQRHGQKQPGQVRDIRHWKKEQRQRPDGGLYDWELVTGEGRLTAAKQLGQKFRAMIVDEPEAKIIGAHLAENIIRKSLPWMDKGRLVKSQFEAGLSAEQIADALSLSVSHVEKLRRIVSKTATGLEGDVASMPINDAEILTALPARSQMVVVEVMREMGDDRPVKAIVRKAQALADDKREFTVTDLRKSLNRVDGELKEMREQLKATRRFHKRGPLVLLFLLNIPEFRTMMKKRGINFEPFLAAMNR